MCKSRIIVSADLLYAKEYVLSKINTKRVKIYEMSEFKVDDAQNVISEAYISEESCKYLVLIATNYNIYAQNTLLKLLEEPPRNISFIIITCSKASLLPTIRSRMAVSVLKNKKKRRSLNLNLNKLDLGMIFLFLRENSTLSKDELKEVIEILLVDALTVYNIRLNERELFQYDMALELADLNSRPQNVLSPLLLTLLHAKIRQN